MWAPWGGWRSNPTSYAGVMLNYSMTPRNTRYINDYQSEYNSEFRPNIIVTPRRDRRGVDLDQGIVNLNDYTPEQRHYLPGCGLGQKGEPLTGEKETDNLFVNNEGDPVYLRTKCAPGYEGFELKELRTHWQTPRLPPWHRNAPRDAPRDRARSAHPHSRVHQSAHPHRGREAIVVPQRETISARSTTASGSSRSTGEMGGGRNRSLPARKNSGHYHDADPSKRGYFAGNFNRQKNGIEFPSDDVEVHHHFHPGNPPEGNPNHGGHGGRTSKSHTRIHHHHGGHGGRSKNHHDGGKNRGASSKKSYSRIYEPFGDGEFPRAPNWRVVAHLGESRNFPTLTRSKSAKLYRTLAPDFLPKSIEKMPTGTDWLSAQCRTRQERALIRQGW